MSAAGSGLSLPLSSAPAPTAGFNCGDSSPPASFELFEPDFRPAPGLYRLTLADQPPYTPHFEPLFWNDRAERRSLELELDLAGCLDSGSP